LTLDGGILEIWEERILDDNTHHSYDYNLEMISVFGPDVVPVPLKRL
jgi:hypothetical protein